MPVRVPRLDQPPHRCAFTLRDQDPEGFFVGEVLSGWDPTAGISVSHVRSLARELGYVHPDDHTRLLEDYGRLVEERDRLLAGMDELNAKFAAIDLLVSAGFVERKKPGRPAQAKEKV